jgi:hypothetical protein
MQIIALKEFADFATLDTVKLFSKLKSHKLFRNGRLNHVVLCFSFTAPQFCSRLNFLFVFPASKVLLSCTCLFPAAKSLF